MDAFTPENAQVMFGTAVGAGLLLGLFVALMNSWLP